ncbi:MAG TPA: DedA family protein [Candidatus Dormibacteraeota bacterium]|nr:DedA family protein [Candidatus Dormibacteraeota bacterium]
MDLGSLLESVKGSGGSANLLAALTVFVQEAGVPLPLPIGGVLLYLGYRATAQPLVLLGLTVLIIELATVLGASAKYWIGLKGGRPLLHSYGRYVRLKEERLQHTERQFRDHGTRTVLLGRALPGITMIMPLAAGALGMPYRRFLPAMATGSGINIVVYVMLGFWAGQSVIVRLLQVGLSLRMLTTLALLAALIGAVVVLRRRSLHGEPRAVAQESPIGLLERALIAGVIAMFEMGIGVNLVLYFMTAVGLLEPQRALLHFIELTSRLAGGGPGALAAVIVLFVAGGVVWSLLYTLAARRYLLGPAPVRGLLFSAVPFVASMGLLSALGFGPLGLALGAGLIPFAGELTRCALFGVGLGTAEEMVRQASSASTQSRVVSPAAAS